MARTGRRAAGGSDAPNHDKGFIKAGGSRETEAVAPPDAVSTPGAKPGIRRAGAAEGAGKKSGAGKSGVTKPGAPPGPHGAPALAEIAIRSYNVELRDEQGFVGDRASGRAFRAILDEIRAKVAEVDDDPFGDVPARDIRKRTLDQVLVDGDPMSAGLVHGAVEEFAQALAGVVRRFLRTKGWREVTQIVVGGGLRQSRVGELAIGRAAVVLKSGHIAVDLVPLRHHPDEAGLLGCLQLAPHWVFEGFRSLVAVDVGGTNIRAGIVRFNRHKATDLTQADVVQREVWRHADDKPDRQEAVTRLCAMVRDLSRRAAADDLAPAPFVGIGVPGVIEPDGSIDRGSQNLPGNWESSRFNLPAIVTEEVPKIDGRDTTVIIHNDAVVQGLSEVPFMTDVPHWAVLTIGTGLGNASFSRLPI